VLGVKKLLEISRQMRSSRPVFIVGEARSGTSILYRTLMKHPSFRPRHSRLVETEIFSHLRRAFMFSRRYPESLVRYMLNDMQQYEAFLASVRILRLVSALSIPINVVLPRPPTWWWLANLNHLLLRSYFFHAWIARGCTRLVEKTPTNTPHIPALTATFPNALLLYIHRHPVDVFSSYRHRGRMDPDAEWARRLTPENFCRDYELAVNRVLNWVGSGHENLLLIPYERFTRSPAREFSRVCEFLDESFDPLAIEERNPGRWSGDPYLFGPIVPVTKRWMDFMTAGEAERIESRLAPTMRRLGYQPYQG
jgi:hypothetical protein